MFLYLESMDRTVPREAPENAILESVDLEILLHPQSSFIWKRYCYILIYIENVLVSTFSEVEPMQIQLHSGLRRWVQICQFRICLNLIS